MKAHPYQAMIRVWVRALKAVSYYDGEHPVLQQLHKEVFSAFQSLTQGGRSVEFACGGSKLILDASEPPLTDDASKALAETLFKRSVVSVHLASTTPLASLSALLSGLGQAPEALRTAGGLAPWLQPRGVSGVEVFEVDFAALFAGKDLGTQKGGPLVQTALRELLRFKDRQSQTEQVLAVTLGDIASPDSLGGFLDDLLSAAPPSLLVPGAHQRGKANSRRGESSATASRSPSSPSSSSGQPGRRGASAPGQSDTIRGVRGPGSVSMEALHHATADEVASLVTQAYTTAYRKLSGRNAVEAALTDTAKVLSSALVRLAPEARFSLLKKLAEQAQKPEAGPADVSAVTQAGAQIDDRVLLETLLATLIGQKGDPELMGSIGGLIRHLRPIESERNLLLESLDANLSKMGHALDGLLWQELQAHAQGKDGLGLLEIPYQTHLTLLQGAANTRRQTTHEQPEIQRVLASLSPQDQRVRFIRLVSEVLPLTGTLPTPMAEALKRILEGLETTIDEATWQALSAPLRDVFERADAGRPEDLSAAIRKCLVGVKGGSALLLKMTQTPAFATSPTLAEIVLHAVDSGARSEVRTALLKEIAAFQPSVVSALKGKLTEFGSVSLPHFLARAMRLEPDGALTLIRMGLKHRDVSGKAAVLRAAAGVPQPDIIALLAQAAGANNDDESRRALFLTTDATTSDDVLRQLQRAAIEALGLSHSDQALKPLEHVLTRKKLMGGASFDLLRSDAARALRQLGSAAALSALTAGRNSSNAAVRAACLKA